MEIQANKIKANDDLSEISKKDNAIEKENNESTTIFNFEKKQPFLKRTRDKIDQYLYDVEIIFKTDMSMKLNRKSRNEYIFRSFFTFFFCFIFSYAVFTAYFIITGKIDQHHQELDQRIKVNGTEIVFEEVTKNDE